MINTNTEITKTTIKITKYNSGYGEVNVNGVVFGMHTSFIEEFIKNIIT